MSLKFTKLIISIETYNMIREYCENPCKIHYVNKFLLDLSKVLYDPVSYQQLTKLLQQIDNSMICNERSPKIEEFIKLLSTIIKEQYRNTAILTSVELLYARKYNDKYKEQQCLKELAELNITEENMNYYLECAKKY